MDYFGNTYYLTDLRVNWLTDGVFMLDPLLRVLSTISSPFPWVAPMVIHKFDPPSGSCIIKSVLSKRPATAGQTLNNPR
jgi:hypothetical protein